MQFLISSEIIENQDVKHYDNPIINLNHCKSILFNREDFTIFFDMGNDYSNSWRYSNKDLYRKNVAKIIEQCNTAKIQFYD